MRTAILDLVYVGLGGFLGSIGRYLATGAVHHIFPNIYFPIGTAVVNIIGCVLIGVLTGLTELRNLLSPENVFTDRFARRIYDFFNLWPRNRCFNAGR